jgi:homoserine kinase
MNSATVFAPATVANVAVGFDILGFAFGELGDTVTVHRVDDPDPAIPVVIDGVRSAPFEGDQDLPVAPRDNTATRALLAMVDDLGLSCGFRVQIEKGIPLGSGMGGSAASAVGAVVAANALLGGIPGASPCTRHQLLPYALAGEAAASGTAHGDNVAPCLFGGLSAFLPFDPPRVVPLPVPSGLHCVLVRPRLRQDTRAQRALLSADVPLEAHVRQSAHLTGFIAACYGDDLELLRVSMQDVLIAPQRGPSIPGFEQARAAARDAGAIGCAIAGSGPSLFAWVARAEQGRAVGDGMVGALAEQGTPADAWVGALSLQGARVEATT